MIDANTRAVLQATQTHIQDTLQKIFHYAPSALSELFPIVMDNFPHKRRSRFLHIEYVNQLLNMCDTWPVLQGRFLDLIISKSIEIDVEIVIEDSGDASWADTEGDDHDHDDTLFNLDDNGRHQTSCSLTEVSEMADKLDAILSLLVRYTHARLVHSTGVQDTSDKLFSNFLDIFENRILVTHKSKFVQFILFFCCCAVPSYGVVFAKRLTELFLNTRNHPLCRQSSVLYLSSLCARANFMPLDKIKCVCLFVVVVFDVFDVET